jgi:hypothetical protein
VDLGMAEPPGADAPGANAAGVNAPGADADVRALGQVLAACLEAVPPGDVTRLPEEVFRLCAACRSPRAGERPSAARAAEVLRDSVRLAPVLDDTGATLVAPLPEPLHEQAPEEAPRAVPVWDEVASKLHRRGDGGVLLRVAVTATLLAVSLATVLLIANRGTLTRALPWDGGVPTASASAGPATSAPGAQPTVPVPVVYETLGRLQPIVDSGQASGRIRSDVAVDLNNSITNLRNDLAAGRTAEAARNLRLLREKIDTRLRERALDESVAAQMTHVLASTPP